MALSKKDFVQVAKELALIKDKSERERATDIQIKILMNSNPRFDAERFRTYVEQRAE